MLPPRCRPISGGLNGSGSGCGRGSNGRRWGTFFRARPFWRRWPRARPRRATSLPAGISTTALAVRRARHAPASTAMSKPVRTPTLPSILVRTRSPGRRCWRAPAPWDAPRRTARTAAWSSCASSATTACADKTAREEQRLTIVVPAIVIPAKAGSQPSRRRFPSPFRPSRPTVSQPRREEGCPGAVSEAAPRGAS